MLSEPSSSVLLLSVFSIVSLHLFIEYVPRKQDSPNLAWLNRTANLSYGIFSFLSLSLSLYILRVEIIPRNSSVLWYRLPYCANIHGYWVDVVLLVYFWSKLWEGVVDLTVVTLRGIPIHIHFRLHHYTTPIFAWLGWRAGTAHGYSSVPTSKQECRQ